MMEEGKNGRVECRKNKRRGVDPAVFQSSNLPIFQSSAGFSLLEVLMALAIFGIAAGGVLVALGNHLKNVAFMQDHARAVRIAAREMNALRKVSVFEEGEVEGAEDRFVWVAQTGSGELDEWPGLSDAPGTPALLTVTVQWSDSPGGPPSGRVRLDGFELFETGN